MRIQKRYFIVGGIVLIGALIAGFVVFAQSEGPWFCNGDFHPGWNGRGFHSRIGGHDFSEHILKRLDHGVEYLDLSESQRQAYEEVREKIQAHLAEGMRERKEFFTEIKTELDRDNPDMERVAGVVKERIREVPGLIEEHVDLFMELYNILDEDQKAQLVHMIKFRMGRRNES